MADIVVDKLVNEIVFKFSEGSKAALDKVNQTFQNLEKSVQNISKHFNSFSGNLTKVSSSIESSGKRAASVSKTFAKIGEGIDKVNKTSSIAPQKIDKTSESLGVLNKVGKAGTHVVKTLSAGYSKFAGVLGLLGQTWRSIRNYAVGATAAMGGVLFGVDKRLSTIDNDSRIAQTEGIDYATQQRLVYGLQKGGDTSAEAKNTIAKLTNQSGSINPGEYNRGLMRIGVDPRNKDGTLKNSKDLLYDMADKLAIIKARLGGDNVHFQEFSKLFGLSPKELQQLSKGSGAFKSAGEELDNSGAVIPNSAGKVAQNFREGSLLKTKAQVSALTAEFATDLTPAIDNATSAMSKWLGVNNKWLAQDMSDYTQGVGQGFLDIASGIKKSSDKMEGFTGESKKPETDADKIKKASSYTKIIVAVAVGLFATLNSEIIGIVSGLSLIVNGFNKTKSNLTDLYREGYFKHFGRNLADGVVGWAHYFSGASNLVAEHPLIGTAVAGTYLYNHKNKATSGNGTAVTNNVTIHVNGASNPNLVANTIQEKLDNIARTSIAATLSPGYNRPRHT